MLLKRTFPIALTMSIGLLVLISYLFPGDVIPVVNVTWGTLRRILVGWAVILAAFALVLGYLNLLAVHFRRIRQGQSIVFSIVLVFSSLLTLVWWVLSMARGDNATLFLNTVFNWVILPGQSALGALLAILVAVAGFRALRVRKTVGMLLFVVSAIIVGLTQPVVPPIGELLRPVREIVIDPLTTGGLRGLLLGVALGSVIVGFRLLLGVDKPQSD